MPTFVLNGVSLNGGTFAGPTQLTVTVPENATLIYEYSTNLNNPGFATSDFGTGGLVSIPEAWLGPANSPVDVSPYGEDENDELYFADILLDTDADGAPNETLTVLVVWNSTEGTDHL